MLAAWWWRVPGSAIPCGRDLAGITRVMPIARTSISVSPRGSCRHVGRKPEFTSDLTSDRSVTVTIPQYRFNETKQHTLTHHWTSTKSAFTLRVPCALVLPGCRSVKTSVVLTQPLRLKGRTCGMREPAGGSPSSLFLNSHPGAFQILVQIWCE